jgi:hypothetical protein
MTRDRQQNWIKAYDGTGTRILRSGLRELAKEEVRVGSLAWLLRFALYLVTVGLNYPRKEI